MECSGLRTQGQDDFGVIAIRLVVQWNLCRYRHNTHYADVRIMPTMVVKPLVVGVDGLGKSA